MAVMNALNNKMPHLATLRLNFNNVASGTKIFFIYLKISYKRIVALSMTRLSFLLSCPSAVYSLHNARKTLYTFGSQFNSIIVFLDLVSALSLFTQNSFVHTLLDLFSDVLRRTAISCSSLPYHLTSLLSKPRSTVQCFSECP